MSTEQEQGTYEIEHIEIPEVILSETGLLVTTSLEVARFFDKRHDNVLRDIEQIISELNNDFSLLNFEVTSHEIKQPNGGTRKTPIYNITRDGFSLLAMGFTGTKALQFKVQYIEAFNAMERALNKGKAPSKKIPYAKSTGLPVQAIVINDIPFKRREFLSKKDKKGLMGLMHFISFLEEVPYEQVEKYILGINVVLSLDKLYKDTVPYVNTQLWRVARHVGMNIFTPKKDIDKFILAQNAFYGLIDFWHYVYDDMPYEKIKNYICYICYIDSFDELNTLIDLQKAIFVVYRGIFYHLSPELEYA